MSSEIIVGVFLAFVAFVMACPILDRWWNLRGVSACCSAAKYGWYTPFGWVVRCQKCHRERM